MDSAFVRVKSIINRLREVLKCQKCLQMKKEDLMVFYNVCDHFYCLECLKNEEENCPLCKNFLDKPILVVNDKNILSLYQSLSKFELPSKQDIEKVYESHQNSKKEALKTLNESPNEIIQEQDVVQDTPKIHGRNRLSLRDKENRNSKKLEQNNSLPSVEETGTITVSSGGGDSSSTPKGGTLACKTTISSGRGKKKETPATKGRKNINSTPGGRGKSVTPQTLPRKETTSSVTPMSGNSKGNNSITKNNINKRNHKGETQLHLACKKSNFSAMADLIAAGANPNAQDNAGWTPLHDAVFSGNVEVIKFLLENGAKVNAPGLENTTALHEAIAKGNAKIVKLLLDNGADVNAMNIFKETPMDLVNKYKLDEMKEIILKCSINKEKIKETSFEPETEKKIILFGYNLQIEEEKLINKFVEKFECEMISSLKCKIIPTHIIISEIGKIKLSWALISTVPKGCRILSINWLKESLKENEIKSGEDFEPLSPLFSGFSKARKNKLNLLPGLFSGCHFFFGGNFESYSVNDVTVGKEELKNLVENNGGAIVKRCPDPESLALEKTIPFHAPATSSLRETSYFIIYQTEKWDPKPKYNMSHMKTLPVQWLLSSIFKFELIDPKEKEFWTNCI